MNAEGAERTARAQRVRRAGLRASRTSRELHAHGGTETAGGRRVRVASVGAPRAPASWMCRVRAEPPRKRRPSKKPCQPLHERSLDAPSVLRQSPCLRVRHFAIRSSSLAVRPDPQQSHLCAPAVRSAPSAFPRSTRNTESEDVAPQIPRLRPHRTFCALCVPVVQAQHGIRGCSAADPRPRRAHRAAPAPSMHRRRRRRRHARGARRGAARAAW